MPETVESSFTAIAIVFEIIGEAVARDRAASADS